MFALNSALNIVYEWGQPEHHPLKRLFMTRLGNIPTAVLEGFTCALSLAELGIEASQFPRDVYLHLKRAKISKESDIDLGSKIREALLKVCKLIVGLLSTLFLGIFLSPEGNFRFHLTLGLATDNLAIKKHKELQARLNAEINAKKIMEIRAAKIAKFQQERNQAKKMEEEENEVDSRLADLLVPHLRQAANH